MEILTSRQWFVRTVSLKDALLARGSELSWHPEWMRSRFQNWVDGLSADWCISRQRFFGVPFPLWYRVGPTAPSTTTSRWSPTRPGCRSTRPPTCPTATSRPTGAGPAASPAPPA